MYIAEKFSAHLYRQFVSKQVHSRKCSIWGWGWGGVLRPQQTTPMLIRVRQQSGQGAK